MHNSFRQSNKMLANIVPGSTTVLPQLRVILVSSLLPRMFPDHDPLRMRFKAATVDTWMWPAAVGPATYHGPSSDFLLGRQEDRRHLGLWKMVGGRSLAMGVLVACQPWVSSPRVHKRNSRGRCVDAMHVKLLSRCAISEGDPAWHDLKVSSLRELPLFGGGLLVFPRSLGLVG